MYPLSRHLANKIVKDVNLPGINDQEAVLSTLYFANFQIAFWAKTHLRYLSIHGQCIPYPQKNHVNFKASTPTNIQWYMVRYL